MPAPKSSEVHQKRHLEWRTQVCNTRNSRCKCFSFYLYMLESAQAAAWGGSKSENRRVKLTGWPTHSVEVMCSSLTPVCMQIWQELPAHRRVEEGEDGARKTATAMALWKRMTYLYPSWQPSSSRFNWPQRLEPGSLRFGYTRHSCHLHPFIVPMCGSNERKEMKRAPTCGSNEKKRTIYIYVPAGN